MTAVPVWILTEKEFLLTLRCLEVVLNNHWRQNLNRRKDWWKAEQPWRTGWQRSCARTQTTNALRAACETCCKVPDAPRSWMHLQLSEQTLWNVSLNAPQVAFCVRAVETKRASCGCSGLPARALTRWFW